MDILKITKDEITNGLKGMGVELEDNLSTIDCQILLRILENKIIPDLKQKLNPKKECSCDSDNERCNLSETNKIEFETYNDEEECDCGDKNCKKEQELLNELLSILKNKKATDLDVENILKKYDKFIIETSYVQNKIKFVKGLIALRKIGDELFKL